METEFNQGRTLLSVKEAAAYLRIAPHSLYQHMQDIPRIHIGRRLVFDRSDLDAYIESHRTKAAITPNKEGRK